MVTMMTQPDNQLHGTITTEPSSKQVDVTNTHPFVSEQQESKLWISVLNAILVIVASCLALAGYAMAATAIIAVTAIVLGIMRLLLQHRSPWKIRSVGFDACISIALGLGLLVTYGSIAML